MTRLLACCSLALALLAAPRVAHGGNAPAVPSPETAAAQAGDRAGGQTLEFFGKTWCWGAATARSDCDVRLGGPASAPEPQPQRAFTLLGLRFCTADAAQGERCDVRLPWARTGRTERHASL